MWKTSIQSHPSFQESDNFAECDIKDVDFIQNQPAAVTASSTNSEEQDALMTGNPHISLLIELHETAVLMTILKVFELEGD